MARKNAPGPSKLKSSKYADVDDGILDSDSEEDEFQSFAGKKSYGRPPSPSGSEDEDDEGTDAEEELSFDEEEGDGVGAYEADEWNEDDDANSDSDASSASGSDDDEQERMKSLKKGLNDIPLETLRKAQKAMRRAPAPGSDDDSDGEPGPSSRESKLAAAKARLAEMQRAKGKAAGVVDETPARRERREREEREEAERIKRENKHAPTVMSTKKQVSRHRSVIDVPKVVSRDPRFSSVSAGQVDANLHAQGYKFLPDMLRGEVRELFAAVKSALKAEKTCKLIEKPLYTAEREALEKDLARVRTKLERAEREQRERDVLQKYKREERDKQASGKGAWFMKDAEKKDLLLKARFADLEQRGGKRAVKKVVDKKMKKVAGKEKKSRPFAAGSGGGGFGGGDQKRRRVA